MSRAVYSYFARMEPCSEIEKTLIMEAADDFSDQIAADVKNFILQLCIESMDNSPRKVIVFPEVNDLGELLIDEIVKIFPNLISFVVGPTKTKRIVVCSHAIVKKKVLEDLAAGNTVNSEGKKLVFCEKDPSLVNEAQSEAVTTTTTMDILSPDPSIGVICAPRTSAAEVSTIIADSSVDAIIDIDNVTNIKSSTPSFRHISSNCDGTTNDDNKKRNSFCDESTVEPLIESSDNVRLKIDDKSKNSDLLVRSPSSSTTTAKIARPDEGTFRRVMTELYIAADRHHRVESKTPASTSSNNWTRNLRNVSSQPPIPPPTITTSTTTTRPAPSTPPMTEKVSSTGEDEKGVPCLCQPEEDIYWKKLACAHLNEIYCILGSVEIVKPKWKQISYDMQISLKEHALGHILETYNMNERVVTRDLTLMFSKFKTSGFNIKWVDSTKALVVFSSATKAAEALTIEHPIIKSRPVLIASRESKLRILQCSQYLLPYKDRPKTVATVARRMISNSLGFPKVEANPEVAEKERNIIEQARAEKLLRGRGESKEKVEQKGPSSPKTDECNDEFMKFEFTSQR